MPFEAYEVLVEMINQLHDAIAYLRCEKEPDAIEKDNLRNHNHTRMLETKLTRARVQMDHLRHLQVVV